MLVCKIEIWPKGDESRKYGLGEVRIANVGGDHKIGHYKVELMKSEHIAKRSGVWRKGQVLNFHRLALGPYDLLLRALIACIGSRSHVLVRREIPPISDEPLFSPASTEELV